MPSVGVDIPMYDSFRPSTAHLNPTQPCWASTQSTMAHDNSPSYSVSSIYSRRSKQSQGSLSFLPSTVYRSEQSEYYSSQNRRPSIRGNIYVSPFRSVRRMKEPFQLVLPASPSFESHLSSGKENRRLEPPIGFPTLRASRSDQHLVAGALESFGLLPSPSLSDSRVLDSPSSVDRSVSEFDSKNDQESPTTNLSFSCDRKPCEGCVSLSSETKEEQLETEQAMSDIEIETPTVVEHRQSDGKPEDGNDMVYDSNPEVIDQLASLPMESAETNPSSGIPGNSKKRTRSGTFSSEASWVPANLSYCETWLQGVPTSTLDRLDGKSKEINRRKCQIVQQGGKHVDLRINTQIANQQPVRYATLASKTKPKIIDISRPSSSGTSYSVPIHMALSARRPSTPEQPPYEISAFSPDTPLDIPDSGYVTQQSNHSSADSRETKDDDTLSDIEEIDIIDTFGPDLNTGSPSITANLHPVKAAASSSYNHSHSPPLDQSPKLQSPPPVSARQKMYDQETLSKWWDYEWTLDQLELSVKNFPDSPLTLTSPVIILLRQNNEKALLKPFKKIFPGVKEPLLGSLCATLIARNYLASMARSRRRSSSLSPGPNILSSVPEKARATLGIPLPNLPHGRFSGHPMGSRSADVRKGLDCIIDHLFLKICGRSDETLKASITVLTQVLETMT